MGRIAKAVAVVTATVVIGTVGVVLTAGAASADEAVVSRVIDGDTVDVRLHGDVERVRLLNIDTPETKDPHEPVECLGPEAADHLRMLLPVGTPITLQYDEDRTDRYGRSLAAVFTSDGTMVNREMTRAGLATAVVFGDNDKFLSEVRGGQDEAASKGRGFFSADVSCTLPAQVASATAAAAAAQSAEAQTAGMSSADLDAAAAEVAAAAALVAELTEEFGKDHRELIWAAFTPQERGQFLARLESAARQATEAQHALSAAAEGARAREAEAARAAAARAAVQAQAARVAAQAEAAARAQQQRNDAEPRRRQPSKSTRPKAPEPAPGPQPAPAPKPAPAPEPAPGPDAGSGNPYPGYTGPRCYAPGGKSWKPCP